MVFWYSSCKIINLYFWLFDIHFAEKKIYVKLCYLIFNLHNNSVLKDKKFQFLHVITFQLSHAKMEILIKPHSPPKKKKKRKYIYI